MKNQKKNILTLVVIGLILFTGWSDNNLKQKVSPHLREYLRSSANEKILVWIYFSDKGENTQSLLSKPEKFLTGKSLDRRIKRADAEAYVDERDLPVNNEYISLLKENGFIIKQKSKWINAVSSYINKNEIEKLALIECVRKIDLVGKFRSNKFVEEDSENGMPDSQLSVNGINYGPSFGQSDIINVPAVHDRGYTGEGILIASFDAGYNNLSHPCFSLMMQRGIRTYDFVNGDTIVADAPGRMGEGSHGILTLSLVAGYAEGNLVSPAFNSRYILAKTENTDSETPVEEDNWIAAAEWADSLGADIITSSLGYLTFDPPYPSYDWTWMSGDSTIITKGANIAVEKGMIVVNSAGNSGFHPQHNTLNAPADGFNVLTVGAVVNNGIRAPYSSIGPTYLTRHIKPDVMAQGSNNVCAMPGAGNTGYTTGATGTSLSTPMIAGVCALILDANPFLTPFQVMDLLRQSGSKSNSPDSLMGWGIVNSLSAVEKAEELSNEFPEDYALYQNFPNPFNPQTTIPFRLNKPGNVTILLYDLSGRLIEKVINNVSYSIGSHTILFNSNSANPSLATGVYLYSLIVDGKKIETKKMVLIK